MYLVHLYIGDDQALLNTAHRQSKVFKTTDRCQSSTEQSEPGVALTVTAASGKHRVSAAGSAVKGRVTALAVARV